MSLRWNVVLTGAIPMAVLQWLFADQFLKMNNPMFLMLMLVGLVYLVGQSIVKRSGATLIELILAMLIGSAVLLVTENRMFLMFGWYIGGTGLALLPMFDAKTRKDRELAISVPEARNVAIIIGVILILVGGSMAENLQQGIWLAMVIGAYISVTTLLSGLAMILIGRTREALRFCCPVALAFVMLMLLAMIVGMPEH
jgi:hypothetical protein